MHAHVSHLRLLGRCSHPALDPVLTHLLLTLLLPNLLLGVPPFLFLDGAAGSPTFLVNMRMPTVDPRGFFPLPAEQARVGSPFRVRSAVSTPFLFPSHNLPRRSTVTVFSPQEHDDPCCASPRR